MISKVPSTPSTTLCLSQAVPGCAPRARLTRPPPPPRRSRQGPRGSAAARGAAEPGSCRVRTGRPGPTRPAGRSAGEASEQRPGPRGLAEPRLRPRQRRLRRKRSGAAPVEGRGERRGGGDTGRAAAPRSPPRCSTCAGSRSGRAPGKGPAPAAAAASAALRRRRPCRRRGLRAIRAAAKYSRGGGRAGGRAPLPLPAHRPGRRRGRLRRPSPPAAWPGLARLPIPSAMGSVRQPQLAARGRCARSAGLRTA